MSDEPIKIDVSKIVPEGWRLVDTATETWRAGDRYLCASNGWVNDPTGAFWFDYHPRITPITPAEPETVDVPVEGCSGRIALIRDPNDNGTFALGYAPNITGPTWAFAGYVWPDGVSCERFFMCADGAVKYCTAVRFRRVKGGAE